MSSFRQQLRRIRVLLRGARLFGALLGILAFAASLWLIFGITDAFLAFESPARVTLTRILSALCALAFLIALIRTLRVSAPFAAHHADAARSDPRASATTALSLDPAAAPTPLASLLTERTLASAATALSAIPAKLLIPWRWLRLAVFALAIPLFVIGGLRLAKPAAFATVAQRLLHPSADIPPYSPLVFTLTPANLSTVYGGEILITAEITGAPLTQPVECLVRHPRTHEVLRLPAFREAPTRFSRKLDALTESVEVAFASGNARSSWHPIEILLEPNILNGLVRITPPAYTGLPATEFPLDTHEISAVEGSTVTLELTSNRPLGSGSLTFTPATAPGTTPTTQSHTATLPASQTAAFTWTSTETGRISATLRDLRGTPSPRPLDLAFRCLPDLPPNVALSSPPPMMLATPKSLIPIAGRAEDDFSLSKVHFVRTLSGFRDRSRVVAPALRDKSYDFSDTLDLDALGLESGQIIELMIDASDHNPSLLGQGSSEISRIQIISEDQYAAYIRNKTTIQQLSNRFQAAREAMNAAREALEKLKEATEKPDPKAIEKAAEEAKAAHEKAVDLLDKIAADFPAFDLEKRLQDLAKKQADDLRANLDPLKNFDPKAPKAEQQAAIDEMLKRLQQQKPEAKQLDQDVAKINQAAAILEMAAKFRQIYEAQASLAKRFGTIVEELRNGQDQNRRLLPSLAETQEKNRKALDEFKTELARRLEALPNDDEDLAPLIDSAREFLLELKTAEPETLMDAATLHGRAGAAMDAFTNAERARALLERLMSEPEPFPQAANGQAPDFKIPRPDVNQTLQQLLEAFLGQGQGDGNKPGGQGQGPAGTGPAGAQAHGFPMDLPVVGPDRLQFASPSTADGGNGDGITRPVQPLPDTAESGTLKPTDTRHGQSTTTTPDAIPETYRDAVKKFLTP